MLLIRNIRIPELSKKAQRKLFIYVPEEAKEDPELRFPVLYMFDGHNVFLDETATYGKSWGMLSYLERNHVPLIVVAPECNHEGTRRLEEYSPYPFSDREFGKLRGQGRVTMSWICRTLKPAIDEEFPTRPEREFTYIAGSSMGGLMALYAVTVWNRTFSRAAALSPSLYVGDGALLDDVKRSRLGADTRIYMDMGSREMTGRRADILDRMERLNRALLKKKADTTMRMVPGGDHSEASWERQIPIFMYALGLQEPLLQEADYGTMAVDIIDETEETDK